jgi:uncharacterized membrane protein (UPF0127 family)
MAQHTHRLIRADNGNTVVEVVRAATNIWSRFVGLQFRSALPKNQGLLIVPCSSIHTMFVRFALDVFFLAKDGTVIEVHRDVRPWKIAMPKQRSHAVLETTAGALDLEAGTQIAIESPADQLQSSLKFLAGANKSEATAC